MARFRQVVARSGVARVTRTLIGLLTVGLCAAVSTVGPGTATAAAPTGSVSLAPADGDTTYGRMMLLLDSSGSMSEPAGGGATKIGAAKAALRGVVGSLPPEAQVGLRVFGATVFSRDDPGACEDSQQVVPPDVDNRGQLLKAIDRYKPYGETPIPYALEQAAADLGDEGARAIVLVSDGESTCTPDPCKTAADLAERGIDLQIDVVGLSVSGAARDQLRCIAEQGNGTYYDVDSAADLEQRLTRVAERAIRPFSLDGEPITGGPEDDPTPVTVGDWVDKLGPTASDTGSKSYLFERTSPGSTLRVSAIGQGRPGDEGLRIEILDPDGERCDIGSAIRQIDAREVVGVQAIAGEENECADAGSYRVTVSRRLSEEGRVPFGLRIAEEPAVSDPGFGSDAEGPQLQPPKVSGRAETVIGGASFANATPIEPGRYSSTVVPGEALMYRFSLDFGQSARIRVVYPSASPSVQDVVGRFPPFARISLYNPMRALLDYPPGADFFGSAGGAEERAQLTGTAEVSREAIGTGGFNGVDDYSMAGDYYLAVSMSREDFTVEFPFTVELEIVGEAQSGPTYIDGATWTVADGATGAAGAAGAAEPSERETSTSAPPAEEPVEARDASGGDGSAAWVTAIVVGIVVALAVLVGIVLWRRRPT